MSIAGGVMVESTIDLTYVAVLILLDTRLQSLSLQAERTKLAVTTSRDNVVTTLGVFVLRRLVGIRQDVRAQDLCPSHNQGLDAVLRLQVPELQKGVLA